MNEKDWIEKRIEEIRHEFPKVDIAYEHKQMGNTHSIKTSKYLRENLAFRKWIRETIVAFYKEFSSDLILIETEESFTKVPA